MRISFCLWVLLIGCGSSESPGVDAATDGATEADLANACALAANTSPTATVTGGCTMLTRDTSACAADRAAAGLSGAWLLFSCRVQLGTTSSGVTIATDSRPDHLSNYFQSTDPCYAPFTTTFPDPNHIAAQSMTFTVPRAPTSAGSTMGLGAVGVAIDGVAIYDNQAAPGDDIFLESGSFDACQGHPDMRGVYHYHSEPYAISYADDALIGVLRDGSFVYGRLDMDGTLPTLDTAGGHTGPTPDSSVPVYHYHAHAQTSTAPGTSGQTVYFLSTGSYHGAPGTCTGC